MSPLRIRPNLSIFLHMIISLQLSSTEEKFHDFFLSVYPTIPKEKSLVSISLLFNLLLWYVGVAPTLCILVWTDCNGILIIYSIGEYWSWDDASVRLDFGLWKAWSEIVAQRVFDYMAFPLKHTHVSLFQVVAYRILLALQWTLLPSACFAGGTAVPLTCCPVWWVRKRQGAVGSIANKAALFFLVLKLFGSGGFCLYRQHRNGWSGAVLGAEETMSCWWLFLPLLFTHSWVLKEGCWAETPPPGGGE